MVGFECVKVGILESVIVKLIQNTIPTDPQRYRYTYIQSGNMETVFLAQLCVPI